MIDDSQHDSMVRRINELVRLRQIWPSAIRELLHEFPGASLSDWDFALSMAGPRNPGGSLEPEIMYLIHAFPDLTLGEFCKAWFEAQKMLGYHAATEAREIRRSAPELAVIDGGQDNDDIRF